MSIATEIERLQNAKTSIKTAIENKGVVVGDGTIDTYASKIEEIKGLDTSDATATENDILKDKTAYINGEKISGTIEEYDGSFEGSAIEGIKIVNADYLFYEGARIENLNDILKICKNISSAIRMFANLPNVNLDLSELVLDFCENMAYMFQSAKITELDISHFNTSSCKDMGYMFQYSKIKELDLRNFDTSKCSSFSAICGNCDELLKLNLSNLDVSKVQNMMYLVSGCKKLTDLDMTNVDLSRPVLYLNDAFRDCIKLTNFKSFKNYGKGFTTKANNTYKIDFSTCVSLSYESLIDIITNGLYDLNLSYDVANGGTLYTQKLVLGSTNLAKLTPEEIRNCNQ